MQVCAASAQRAALAVLLPLIAGPGPCATVFVCRSGTPADMCGPCREQEPAPDPAQEQNPAAVPETAPAPEPEMTEREREVLAKQEEMRVLQENVL
jgi:hypothetical protein